jgi:ParB-like chromosome segregation protein Spo0J
MTTASEKKLVSASQAEIELKPLHPLCKLFPVLSDEELSSLADDIRANGLQEPIKLWNGQVIDGQNRQLACARAHEEPRYKEMSFEDEDEVKFFIISKNIERRHLTKSQRAMALAMIYPEDKGSRGKAKSLGVSSELLRQARSILKGDQELADKVLGDKISVKKALAEIDDDKPDTNDESCGKPNLVGFSRKNETPAAAAESSSSESDDEVDEDVDTVKPAPQVQLASVLQFKRSEPVSDDEFDWERHPKTKEINKEIETFKQKITKLEDEMMRFRDIREFLVKSGTWEQLRDDVDKWAAHGKPDNLDELFETGETDD